MTSALPLPPDIAPRGEARPHPAARSPPLAASPKVQLKNFGSRVAIDDFGVGYTSFRNLRKLGGDIVKIDGAALMLRDCGCDYVQC